MIGDTNAQTDITRGLPYARLIGGVYNDISGSSATRIGFVSAPEISNSEYFQRVENSSPYYSLKILKTGRYLLSLQVYGSPVSVSGGRLEASLVEDSNLQSTFTINTAGNTGQNVGATMTKIVYLTANTVVGLAGWYQDSNFTVTGAGGNTFLTLMWIGA